MILSIDTNCAEDEHLVAALEHLVDRLEEGVELAAGVGLVEVLGHEQTGVRADLAQAGQRGQHVHGRALGALVVELGQHVAARGFRIAR